MSACANLPVLGQSGRVNAGENPNVVVLTPQQISYQPLNPARGDASPRAGVLWGDIRKDVPSGVLLRFADGFSSPPHIHNITYRAIVISGKMHNDDPDAADMWMGPGSYWMQPAGEVHVTAARDGNAATAFLEILEGPYLVQPGEDAFHNHEQPVNLTDTNMVWLNAKDMQWIDANNRSVAGKRPQVTFLWGSTEVGKPGGSLVKLPGGYDGQLLAVDSLLRSVVIHGKLHHQVTGITEDAFLEEGGYFSSNAGIKHQIACVVDDECLVYVRTDGRFELK